MGRTALSTATVATIPHAFRRAPTRIAVGVVVSPLRGLGFGGAFFGIVLRGLGLAATRARCARLLWSVFAADFFRFAGVSATLSSARIGFAFAIRSFRGRLAFGRACGLFVKNAVNQILLLQLVGPSDSKFGCDFTQFGNFLAVQFDDVKHPSTFSVGGNGFLVASG